MPVREEPAIEDENAAYFRPARGSPRSVRSSRRRRCSKTTTRKSQRRPALWTGRRNAPDCLDEIGAFGSGIGISLGLSLSPMPTYSTKSFGISAAFGKYGRTFAHPNEPSGNPGRKETACASSPSRLKKILSGASCRNDGAGSGVVADTLHGEPSLGRRGHGKSPLQAPKDADLAALTSGARSRSV